MTATDKYSHRGHWLEKWHVNPSVNRDYDFIDGLRGIAILMVICCHHFYVNPSSDLGMLFLGELFGSLGSGVNLFFALSGFLISWPFWKNKILGKESNVRRYVSRRFWKIYPPLLVSIVIFTPIYIYQTHDWTYFRSAMQWLTGLAFLFPVSGNLNPVMWSLVIEVQFYIILPILFWCLRQLSPLKNLFILPLLFLIIPTAYQLSTGKSPTIHPDINANFPSAMSSFAFGILIAGLDCNGLMRKKFSDFGFLGFFVWPLALTTLAFLRFSHIKDPYLHWGVEFFFMIGSALLLTFVANPQHHIARALCAPWLRWCGMISYEWYLIHQPLVLWSRNYLGPAQGSVFKFLFILGFPLMISTLSAALVYRYYSMPILKWRRGSLSAAN